MLLRLLTGPGSGGWLLPLGDSSIPAILVRIQVLFVGSGLLKDGGLVVGIVSSSAWSKSAVRAVVYHFLILEVRPRAPKFDAARILKLLLILILVGEPRRTIGVLFLI